MKKILIGITSIALILCLFLFGKEQFNISEEVLEHSDESLESTSNSTSESALESEIDRAAETTTNSETETITESVTEAITEEVTESALKDSSENSSQKEEEVSSENEPEYTIIEWDDTWQYADYSILHDTSVKLYRSPSAERKNIVVTVNAGHGTSGGNKVKTFCHPDGSPKVTGGSTAEGSKKAAAVSSGTSMLDGTPEGDVNLSLALLLKDTLLVNGYDVLMIRETKDAQIDNIARTVFANNNSDCHIAIHYNSTEYDAGFFYIGVPDIISYKEMEPVASHWKEHNAFGAALLEGIKEEKIKVCEDGFMGLDLTQTSYSTIPSTDVEVGDRASDYSKETQQKIADGILAGLNIWFD